MIFRFLVVCLAVVFSSGCASIVSNNMYPVSFTSSPSGASFSVTDVRGIEIHNGKTPATITLDAGDGYFAKAEYRVSFYKDGFETQQFIIRSTLDGWYWGNLLFGGLIGFLIVDPASGAMWKLRPQYTASLRELNSADATEEPSLTIMSLDSVPEDQRGNLVRVR